MNPAGGAALALHLVVGALGAVLGVILGVLCTRRRRPR